jgi:hypothetical protein
MIRHSFKAPFILLLVFGMFIFLLPCGVFAQNQTPVAIDDEAVTAKNTSIVIDVAGNDSDPDNNLNQNSAGLPTPPEGPSHGTAVGNGNGTITYIPNTDFTGTDTFVYKICDTAEPPLCDTALVTIDVAVPVAVDIKPGSCPNPFNLKSRGVLPVAILGTADFDVNTIDRASIKLLINSQEVRPTRSSIEDVATPFTEEIASCESCTDLGSDGYSDLTLKFSTQAIVQAIGVDNVNDGDCFILTLTGTLNDGTPIAGEDVLRILKKGKTKPPKDPNPHKPPKN